MLKSYCMRTRRKSEIPSTQRSEALFRQAAHPTYLSSHIFTFKCTVTYISSGVLLFVATNSLCVFWAAAACSACLTHRSQCSPSEDAPFRTRSSTCTARRIGDWVRRSHTQERGRVMSACARRDPATALEACKHACFGSTTQRHARARASARWAERVARHSASPPPESLCPSPSGRF